MKIYYEAHLTFKDYLEEDIYIMDIVVLIHIASAS